MDHNDFYLFGIVDEYQDAIPMHVNKEQVIAELRFKANRNDSVRNALTEIGLRTIANEYEKWGGIE